MADTMTLSEAVAEEIRALLARRRMSGRQLAALLDVSQTWMSTRLKGTTPIDLNELSRIAAALNVEVAELLPRANEGRLITTGGALREKDRQLNVGKGTVAGQPRPNGHPKRTQPHPSTRRPVRLPVMHLQKAHQ